MVWEKPLDSRCLNKLENDKTCGQEIKGQGARLYCGNCGKAAQREARRERDRKRSAKRRAADREGDNIYHWLYNHKLTAPQMEDYITDGKALRELYRGLKADDLYQRVIDQLRTISRLWLNPPTTLPSAHAAVTGDLCALRAMVESRPDDGPNSPRDKLLHVVKEVSRDQGGWMADDPFSTIGRQAQELQEAWRIRGDVPHLTVALFVNAEWWRQRYFATQDHMPFWKKAVREVKAAAYVASLTKEADKRLSTFLDFYAWQAHITLALDIDVSKQVTGHIHLLPDLANKVANAWGGGSPVSEVALFLASMQQALYYLSLNDPTKADKHFIDEAEKHFNDAETMFANPMQWCPVSEQQTMAYIKASLALARGAPDREEQVHEYTALWSRNPSFEQERNIARLKQFYDYEVPEAALAKDRSIYVETCFNYLQPLLLPYTDIENCGSDAVSRTEEGGDGMYPAVKN
jgi:hypothetical protein